MGWFQLNEDITESHDDMSTDEFQQPQKQPEFSKTDSEDKKDNNERRNASL
jgi:hypothetical protein